MKVKFVPQNVEYEIRPGQSVLELAQEKGVHIRSTCNGLPSCAECRIRLTEGDYNVSPPTTKELNLIGTGYFLDQRRLSCQLTCFGDVTVDTTEHVGKEGEGAVTKQFLQRVQKTSAEQTHSVNGVLIEQDAELLNNVEASEVEERSERQQQQREHREHRGGGGGGRDNRQRHHQNQNRQQQGKGGGGGGVQNKKHHNRHRHQNARPQQNQNQNRSGGGDGGKPS